MGRKKKNNDIPSEDLPAEPLSDEACEPDTIPSSDTDDLKDSSTLNDDLHQQIDELKQKLSTSETALNDAIQARLRASADLENFRKRKEQEVASFKKYACESFILDILPVVDSFELAMANTDESIKDHPLLEGMTLIQKQFRDALKKLGVSKIDADGQTFDPQKHQAVSQEEKEGVEPDTIIQVMQDGYMLHDKVIRPSMVAVSK